MLSSKRTVTGYICKPSQVYLTWVVAFITKRHNESQLEYMPAVINVHKLDLKPRWNFIYL